MLRHYTVRLSTQANTTQLNSIEPHGQEGHIKRILITGANKGIGLATAQAILEQHDDAVVLLGARDPGRGQSALQSLCSTNSDWSSRLALVTIDVANPGSVLAARDQLLNHYGSETAPLYGLVNNAGIGLGSSDFDSVVDVNTLGVQRVCEAFMPLMEASGRVVNVSSASGPKYVSQCSPQRQQFFRGPNVKWPDVENLIKQAQQACDKPERCKALGLGDLNAYGFSKACVSLYTMALAQQYPQLQINACTPGYIETDLTRPQAKKHGVAPAEMGMKPPAHGTIAILHLLFGHPQGSGHYYGSDAKRSPLDRYRAPGGPEYTGDD